MTVKQCVIRKFYKKKKNLHSNINNAEQYFVKVLNRVYNHDKDWIDYELYDISSAYEAEKKSKESLGGLLLTDNHRNITTIIY